MAATLQMQPNLRPTFKFPNFSIPRTPKILYPNSITPSKTCKFLRPPKSTHHGNNNSSTSSSSSDETSESKQVLEEDDNIQKIKMDVSPSVMKALEEGGVGLIERNRVKREARFEATQSPTKLPTMPLKEEDCHDQIYEAFKSDMPMLPKPGKLEIDMIFQLIDQYSGLDIVIPSVIYIGEKLLDENLYKGSMSSLLLAFLLRSLGGLKFDRDKASYSERVVLFIVYNYLVEQMKVELDRKNNSRAEELASAIAEVKHLVKTGVTPEKLVLYAFENSGFVPDGRIVRYEGGFVFPGTLKGHPEDAINQIQQYIDSTGQDNVAIFTKSRTDPKEAWCVIAPWSWFLGFILPDGIYNWICGFSFLGAFIGALQFSHADLGLEPMVWEPIVIPTLLLCTAGAGAGARWLVASKCDVVNLIRWPAIFPCVGLGAMGAVTGYKGCLPNRSCFLNLSLASVFSSLTFSSLVIFLGYSVGSSNAFSDAVVDFHGYFSVPLHMFSYSSFFTFLLKKLSIATLIEETENINFVISPISLSGLLGLSFCSFQLLPVSRSEGSRILAAILGRETKNKISVAVQILLTACFMFKNPLLGFAWWSYIGFAGQYDDLFQREEATEPPLYGKLLGLGLVSAAFAAFVPVLW